MRPCRRVAEVRHAVGRWKVCKWTLAGSEQRASLRLVSKDEMIRQPQQAQARAMWLFVPNLVLRVQSTFRTGFDTWARVRGLILIEVIYVPPGCQSGRWHRFRF